MHGGGCYNQGGNVLKCVNKNTAYIDASYLCISVPFGFNSYNNLYIKFICVTQCSK